MKDTIYREDAIEALKIHSNYIDGDAYPHDCACDIIRGVPSADRPSATEIMNAYHEGVRKGIAEAYEAYGADRPPLLW